LDIDEMIKKSAREVGAKLVGFSGLDGESVVVLAYPEENAGDLVEIDEKAEWVSNHIRQAGFDARIIGSMDGEGISLRSLAEEAGLGFIGRSGLLITEKFGPEVRLSGILTNANLRALEDLSTENGCSDCIKCQKACPSGAIEKKSVEVCKSYNENQKEGRCTICIYVCPYSRR
jgi:epoxyqueuosine reductase QueG